MTIGKQMIILTDKFAETFHLLGKRECIARCLEAVVYVPSIIFVSHVNKSADIALQSVIVTMS